MFQLNRRFELLTATFSHGAYQSQSINKPELRAASVKGQLRWWYDAIFSDQAAEDKLFGFAAARGNQASKIAVRLADFDPEQRATSFMPHKQHQGGTKNAILPGSRYMLNLMARREDLDALEQRRLERATDAWLLLGAIGQRSNRCAGSVWPEDAPLSEAEFAAKARLLLEGARLKMAVLPGAYQDEKLLRSDAGDFLASQAFIGIGTPFGAVGQGLRKPSQLRLRAARLDGGLRLIAIWDARFERFMNLQRGVEKLAQANKPIGLKLMGILQQLGE